MLAVCVQPYSYKHIRSLSDIKQISIIKFGRKQLFEDDYSFEVVYDGIPKKEIVNTIVSNCNDENVITYSGGLLYKTMRVLSEVSDIDFDYEKITGLMELYASAKSKPWTKLCDALASYDFEADFDRDDPMEMAKYTMILYRLMVKNNDL